MAKAKRKPQAKKKNTAARTDGYIVEVGQSNPGVTYG
jgi:hypothetical protein